MYNVDLPKLFVGVVGLVFGTFLLGMIMDFAMPSERFSFLERIAVVLGLSFSFEMCTHSIAVFVDSVKGSQQ